MKLLVKRLPHNPDLPLPRHQTDGAAGIDLYAAMETGVPADGRYIPVSTGLVMAIPEGYVGLIKPRSGMARKMDVEAFAGTIDSDFRGDVTVLLRSLVIDPELDLLPIHRGDRIAQLVIVPVQQVIAIEVEELPQTQRNAGGFGSTDVVRPVSAYTPTARSAVERKIAVIGGEVE